MKLAFNIGNVKSQEVSLENISVEVAFNSQELSDNYNTVRQMIKEIPSIMTDLKGAMTSVNSLCNEMESKENQTA